MCLCVGGGGIVRQYTMSREPLCGIIVYFMTHICYIKVVNWLFKALHNPFIHTCSGHMHALVVLSDTLPRAVISDVPIR